MRITVCDWQEESPLDVTHPPHPLPLQPYSLFPQVTKQGMGMEGLTVQVWIKEIAQGTLGGWRRSVVLLLALRLPA